MSDWLRLLEPDIQSFINAHEKDDVAALALKKPSQADWPYPLILDQIKSRQKAAFKIPAFLAPGLVLPAPDVIEQCSSQAAAAYKASLCQGERFADLTGGAGVDCAALAKNFKTGFCLERDERSAALLAHNLPLLGAANVQVLHTDAERWVETMPDVDLVYLDPQRRDAGRKGKYILNQCSPDVTALLPALKKQRVLLKTSPMLDIDAAIQTLGCVQAVHTVEWRGECREILYILARGESVARNDIPITAARIDDEGFPAASFSFTRAQEEEAAVSYALPRRYLYEPGPAFMKAGGFNALAETYGAAKLHKNTHLYTSNSPLAGFPGRGFEILEILSAALKTLPFEKANLTLRNFPGDTAALRKKWGLAEGGDSYLFACVLADDRKAILSCRKI